MANNVLMQGKLNTDRTKVQEVFVNSGGQLISALLNGELQQFNRLAGGAIVSYAAVSADGIVITGPCIFYGVKVVTAGTSITVYDNTAASGTAVMTTEATTTAGAVLTPAGVGVGVLMSNGIYVDLTTGTYLVYYVPVV